MNWQVYVCNTVHPTKPNIWSRQRVSFGELNNAAKSIQEDILQTEIDLPQVLIKLKPQHLQNLRL